ncbi:uncharacterized protein LOC136006014 [Lathamus discolor]|uniref:uncharacterized protein LOC136006014 n=1 Tax=Lathamus discolor TaxID=678569 RepID=UPI0032B77280
MAMELEDCCPICLGSWEEVSYVMPCLHRFCYQCILRWAETKPECPLCKGRIQSLLHSVRADDDYVEHVITPSEASSAAVHQARRAASHRATRDFQRRAAEVVPTGPVVGFWTPNWLSSLQDQPALFQTLQSWYQRDLEEMFGTALFGSRETRHRLNRQSTRAAREREGTQEGHLTPRPTTSSSPSRSTRDELPSTSSAATGGGPSSHPSAPSATPVEQEEPQQQPEEAMPSWHRQRSTRRQGRPPKRKSSSHEDPPAKKRPPPRL